MKACGYKGRALTLKEALNPLELFLRCWGYIGDEKSPLLSEMEIAQALVKTGGCKTLKEARTITRKIIRQKGMGSYGLEKLRNSEGEIRYRWYENDMMPD